MTRYSVLPRNWIFEKDMEFCLLLEIWKKYIGKNISKN